MKSIAALTGKSEAKFSKTDFHALRVEIKRLRAAFDVLVTTDKKFPKERFFKPFRTLFRQAGVVRELQLEEEVLIKSEIPGNLPEYVSRLRKTLDQENRTFYSLRSKLSPKKIKTLLDDLKRWVRQVRKKDIDTYLKQKKKKIKKLMSLAPIQAAQLHKLRKLLKEYAYIESMHRGKNKRRRNKDAFQELLGQWHDLVVMAAHFQKNIDSGNLTTMEKEYLDQVKDKLLAESNALFIQIQEKKV